ncbi:unnamed protein product, partial [Discosporangium mesarthrocarpum]
EGLDTPTCSGLCTAGYYCLTGSTLPTQHHCGHAGVYCPEGSSAPTEVLEGFYTAHSGPEAGTQSAQVLCEPGHYCTDGVKYQCREGTFHWEYGITSAE